MNPANPSNPCMVFIMDECPDDNVKISYPQKHSMMQSPIYGSIMEQTEGSFGKFATEYRNEGNGEVLQHRWLIQQPIVLHPYSQKPNITIHYMLWGSIDCYLRGEGSVTLNDGMAQMFYLPAGIEQDAHFKTGKYHSFQIVFSDVLLKSFMKESSYLEDVLALLQQEMASGKQLASAPITPYMMEVIERIRSCRHEGVRREKFIEAQMYELLAAYLEGIKVEEGAVDRINKLVDYLRSNLQDHPTVDSLAKSIGLTSVTFSRYFKQHTGQNFRDFMKEQRVTAARRLLMESMLAIKDIAFECGFYDTSDFVHQFKQVLKLTPSEYRKLHGIII